MTSAGWDAAIYLEKGHVFEGQGFGAESGEGGEVVFNTGMTGYQEIFTDPSYYKQIVVMTYPHLGNTAVNPEDVESKGLFLSGVVAREYCTKYSNWRATKSLDEYLKAAKVTGISDVDTREITQVLRDEGAQRGIIFSAGTRGTKSWADKGKELMESVENMEGLELVSRVSCKEPYIFETPVHKVSDKDPLVVCYDFGVKTNILRSVASYGFRVRVVPYNYPGKDILKEKPAAVVLSNGPGDPGQVADSVIESIQALTGKVPTLAICMGHQLLARSLGANTFKLKFGHHGVNHPVKDLKSGKILITSQNHGFSVKADDLKQKDVSLGHISLNDQTVEGFSSEKMKFYSVQFHPEAKPGPSDAGSLFDYFVRGFVK